MLKKHENICNYLEIIQNRNSLVSSFFSEFVALFHIHWHFKRDWQVLNHFLDVIISTYSGACFYDWQVNPTSWFSSTQMLFLEHCQLCTKCHAGRIAPYPEFQWADGKCSPPVWLYSLFLLLGGQHSHHPPAERPGSCCPGSRSLSESSWYHTWLDNCPAKTTNIEWIRFLKLNHLEKCLCVNFCTTSGLMSCSLL